MMMVVPTHGDDVKTTVTQAGAAITTMALPLGPTATAATTGTAAQAATTRPLIASSAVVSVATTHHWQARLPSVKFTLLSSLLSFLLDTHHHPHHYYYHHHLVVPPIDVLLATRLLLLPKIMTVISIEASAEDTLPTTTTTTATSAEEDEDLCLDTPDWVEDESLRNEWGLPLSVLEWEDHDSYRTKNGWKGSDLIHDRHSPVRILEYFVNYGKNGLEEGDEAQAGGVGTTLTGIAHFTKRAESHKGYCHGGSMCSLMDDVIGWCAFLTTGKCLPWSGYTVQVNTSLQKPIKVDSYLLIRAKIMKVERRKVFIEATLIDPADNTTSDEEEVVVHAKGEGLVILNKGVLPLHLEQQQQQQQQRS